MIYAMEVSVWNCNKVLKVMSSDNSIKRILHLHVELVEMFDVDKWNKYLACEEKIITEQSSAF